MLRNILVNSDSQQNYILEAHLIFILKPAIWKEGINLFLLDYKHLRGGSLAMLPCQNYGVT